MSDINLPKLSLGPLPDGNSIQEVYNNVKKSPAMIDNSSTKIPDAKKCADCAKEIKIAIFFDGTTNNMHVDNAKNALTNIAGMYKLHKGVPIDTVTDLNCKSQAKDHIYKIYIQGVGTAFQMDIGKFITAESAIKGGGMFGYGGESRLFYVFYKIIQIMLLEMEDNNFEKLTNTNIFARTYDKEDAPYWIENAGPFSVRVVSSMIDITNKYITSSKKSHLHITGINIDIFGFSRGATAARSFLQLLLKTKEILVNKTKGNPWQTMFSKVYVNFLGIMDTVASVGLAGGSAPIENVVKNIISSDLSERDSKDTVLYRYLNKDISSHMKTIYKNYSPALFSDLGGVYGIDYEWNTSFTGHNEWASAELLVVPNDIKCLHLVALNEVRRHFSLTTTGSIKGTYPKNTRELGYLGSHSDVGGGYVPDDTNIHKHASDPYDEKNKYSNNMLSNIPGLYMYQEALKHGVDFENPEKLSVKLQGFISININTLRKPYEEYLHRNKTSNNYSYIKMHVFHMAKYFNMRLHIMKTHIKTGEMDPLLRSDKEENDTLYIATTQLQLAYFISAFDKIHLPYATNLPKIPSLSNPIVHLHIPYNIKRSSYTKIEIGKFGEQLTPEGQSYIFMKHAQLNPISYYLNYNNEVSTERKMDYSFLASHVHDSVASFSKLSSKGKLNEKWATDLMVCEFLRFRTLHCIFKEKSEYKIWSSKKQNNSDAHKDYYPNNSSFNTLFTENDVENISNHYNLNKYASTRPDMIYYFEIFGLQNFVNLIAQTQGLKMSLLTTNKAEVNENSMRDLMQAGP